MGVQSAEEKLHLGVGEQKGLNTTALGFWYAYIPLVACFASLSASQTTERRMSVG
jgi:hypothetical protein